ncbi:MAG: LPS export ABC transporter periplasmic protein LptC [Armatimonadota bacterium]
MMQLGSCEVLRKVWPLATAICVVACLGVSLVVFRRYLPYTDRQIAPGELPRLEMVAEDTRVLCISNGTKLWSLCARRVELAQNRSSVTMRDITNGMVYQKDRPILKVRARKLYYDEFSGCLTVSDSVDIRGMQGQRVYTPGLVWNISKGVLCATGHVLFESSLGKILAGRLSINIRNSQIELSDVHGTMHFELPGG